MNPSTLNIIQVTLQGDKSVSAEERQLILGFCKSPKASHPADSRSTRYFSRKGVAQELQVSVKTVDRWIARGQLRSIKPGGFRRIPQSAINDLLESLGDGGQNATSPIDIQEKTL